MTIAAGFTCSDGVILATDLEVTEGLMIKRAGGKGTFITPEPGVNIGIVGAGNYDMLAYACEVIGENVKGSTQEAIVDRLRANLKQLYQEHICLSWPESQWGEVIQLLVGVSVHQDSDWGLYKSERSILRRTGPYDFVGAGRELAYYVMQGIRKKGAMFPREVDLTAPDALTQFLEFPSIEACLPVARKVILEVGENVAYCGKGANILKIPCEGMPSYDIG